MDVLPHPVLFISRHILLQEGSRFGEGTRNIVGAWVGSRVVKRAIAEPGILRVGRIFHDCVDQLDLKFLEADISSNHSA